MSNPLNTIENIILDYCEGTHHLEFSKDDLPEMVAQIKQQVSNYQFLDDELQVTNSDELAVHVYKGLSEMRFKQIIELEDENHELRKMLDKAFDAGFEFNEEE